MSEVKGDGSPLKRFTSMPIVATLGSGGGLVYLVVFGVFMVFGLAIVSKDLPLSPIDEHTHLDYVLKAGQLHIPLDEEMLGQETMRIMACNRVDVDMYLPPCGEEIYSPSSFPDNGYSMTASSPPTYFVLTGLLARSIRVFTPLDDLLASARLANWTWLAFAGTSVFALLRRRSVRLTPAFAVSSLMLLNPVAVTAGVNVNPDGMLPLAGLILVSLAWRRSERWWSNVAVGGVVAVLLSIDGGMVLPLLLALCVLGVRGAAELLIALRTKSSVRESELVSIVGRVAALLGGFFAGPPILDAVRKGLTGSLGYRYTSLPRDEWFPRPAFSLDLIFGGFWGNFPAIRSGYIIAPLRDFEFTLAVEIAAVVVAGLVVTWAFTRESWRDQVSALSTLAIGMFAIPLMTFLLWMKGGGFWTLTPRFAIAILAVIFLAAGSALTRRAAEYSVVLVATVLTVIFLQLTLSYTV